MKTKSNCITVSYLKTALAVTLIFSAVYTRAQIISTIAGSGPAGPGTGSYTGDGGAATAATMNTVTNVAFDGSGNMYIADGQNNVIRKVNTSGVITTVVGTGIAGFSGDGGPASSAKLNGIGDVIIDAAGNLLIADELNHCIRKVNGSGIITTIAGTGGISGYSGDGGPATSAHLNHPIRIAFDFSGNLLIADASNNVIRKVDGAGIITTIAGISLAGYSGDGGAATAAKLWFPSGVAVDGSGNIYVADTRNNVIRRINSSGIISTIAGTGVAGYSGDGGMATLAMLTPGGHMAIDCFGNLCFNDVYRVRKVNLFSGYINTVAGSGVASFSGDGGPATAAAIRGGGGVIFDNSGNMIISDGQNNRVRKVTATPITGGSSSICIGATVTLSYVPGGTWSSSNTSIAAVGSNTGVVTGISAGTVTITYNSSGGCYITTPVTVNAAPAISGPSDVCAGASITLTAGSGIWSSSDITTATIGSSSGIVTGVAAGSAIISFTDGSTGCSSTYGITVNASTPTISGPSSMCQGADPVTLAAGTSGTWASSDPSIAAISATGNVTGTSAGTVTITYTDGCGYATYSFTVHPLPNAGTVSGPSHIGYGGTGTYTTTGDPGGDFFNSNGYLSPNGWVTAYPSVTLTACTSCEAGTGYVVYSITNSWGCTAVSPPVTVSVP